ncbi:MAG: DegV family protein [Anaerotignum faecicola]
MTKTAGFVGTMLSICPLLHVNYDEGKLIPVQKVRTKKKVIEAIEKEVEELAKTAWRMATLYFPFCCQADAEAVASLVESRFPNLNGRVLIDGIGTTIGSHTGPGTVALFFGERKENHKNRQSLDVGSACKAFFLPDFHREGEAHI